MNQQIFKNLALWVVLVVTLILLLAVVNRKEEAPEAKTYSQLTEMLRHGQVTSIVIEDGAVSGFSEGKKFTSFIDPSFYESFQAEVKAAREKDPNLSVDMKRKPETSMWQQLLFSMGLPLLLIIGFWVFMARQMQAGGGKAMSFGKSRARLLTENQTKMTFDDVAGVEESKTELEEIIAFLRDPKKFTRLGGRIPKGVLLVGPPGTGKTLLARAVAGEAGVPFFSISGSDFVEMFVGVGASRVRDLFMQGKKHAPCIIFIDEIDAVGRHRGAGMGGGHDEREQTLNQLLVEMDGFESNEGVILIAATNRPDVLDPALLRPGRFDRRVVVPRPDLRGRLMILRVHTRKVPVADDVDLDVLARGTPGFVGADLQNLVNEAALLAARREANRVAMVDFEKAKDKVLMGAERRSMIMSDEEKRTTAYHEAGHALVALLTEESDPVHKVTIIPRGMALGLTQTLPEEDRHSYTRAQMVAIIKYAMGGRAAEELVFSHFSTGAANDLQRSTRLARDMICTYGMSDAIGPVSFDEENGDIFLGRDYMTRKNYSEKTAELIDDEVKRLLSTLYDEAKAILAANRIQLDRIADALLERETLETSDLAKLLAGETLPPLPPPTASAPAGGARPARPARTREPSGVRGGGSAGSGADRRIGRDKSGVRGMQTGKRRSAARSEAKPSGGRTVASVIGATQELAVGRPRRSGKRRSAARSEAKPSGGRTVASKPATPASHAFGRPLRPAAPELFRRDGVTILGVLNVTPDSFSDGGRFTRARRVDLDAVLAEARAQLAAGAHVLDVGGESTRPGAQPVTTAEELARTLPVVEALAKALDAPISIDTRRAEVAEAALGAGACVVNDVTGGAHDPELLAVAARGAAWLILGHLRGEPATMQREIAFVDVLAEVGDELAAAIARAEAAGVARERIVADPGIGFGKRTPHSLALLANSGALRARLGVPILVGPSRKSFLGELTGERDPVRRDVATHAACAVALFAGADAVRVHDVAGARIAAQIALALREAQR